jgi:DNA repair protein RecO (recombination protein O)
MRVALQPAFVLHHRPYRETSLLVDLFTEEHGRIAVVAKSVRTQRSPLRSILQPFTPLIVSWQGKTELMALTLAEGRAAPLLLQGDCLLSGLYLNELLVRVLQKNDPHPVLYHFYQHTLTELQGGKLEQKILRIFEKKLLAELGYGVQLRQDFITGKLLKPEDHYQYFAEQGFTICMDSTLYTSAYVFSGKSLLALDNEQFHDEESLRDAKRLIRLLLASLLGTQQIFSRKLFL